MMSNNGEAPAPKRKVPTAAMLREILWLPKWSLWGFVGTLAFIGILIALILMFLIRDQPQ
jgi:hypothetical protein